VWRHKPLVKELRVKKHRANSGDNVARKRQPVATTKKKQHKTNIETTTRQKRTKEGRSMVSALTWIFGIFGFLAGDFDDGVGATWTFT
jgi:hypothetical protein